MVDRDLNHPIMLSMSLPSRQTANSTQDSSPVGSEYSEYQEMLKYGTGEHYSTMAFKSLQILQCLF